LLVNLFEPKNQFLGNVDHKLSVNSFVFQKS